MKCASCNHELSSRDMASSVCPYCRMEWRSASGGSKGASAKATAAGQTADPIRDRIMSTVARYAPPAVAEPNLPDKTPEIRSWADMYEAKRPGVVVINNVNSTGSGFILPGGYIGTNAHVVSTDIGLGITMFAPELEVKLDMNARTSYKARIIAANREQDVAVLEFVGARPSGLIENKLGDSHSLRPGDPVCSIGNSLGEGISYNQFNIKSATGRHPRFPDKWEVISLNGPAQGGNSGGPLYNMEGEVVGMITMGRIDPSTMYLRTEDGVQALDVLTEDPGLSYAVTVESLMKVFKSRTVTAD